MNIYKEALNSLRFISDNTVAYPNQYKQAEGLEEAFHTIEQALKLAARLEQEPSEDMLEAAPARNTEGEQCMYAGIFKAMIAQLKKEVKDA